MGGPGLCFQLSTGLPRWGANTPLRQHQTAAPTTTTAASTNPTSSSMPRHLRRGYLSLRWSLAGRNQAVRRWARSRQERPGRTIGGRSGRSPEGRLSPSVVVCGRRGTGWATLGLGVAEALEHEEDRPDDCEQGVVGGSLTPRVQRLTVGGPRILGDPPAVRGSLTKVVRR
jgi:hypothetical protein